MQKDDQPKEKQTTQEIEHNPLKKLHQFHQLLEVSGEEAPTNAKKKIPQKTPPSESKVRKWFRALGRGGVKLGENVWVWGSGVLLLLLLLTIFSVQEISDDSAATNKMENVMPEKLIWLEYNVRKKKWEVHNENNLFEVNPEDAELLNDAPGPKSEWFDEPTAITTKF